MELFYSTLISNIGTHSQDKKILFLTNEEASHCVKVLRHKEGDTIFVINGAGTLYRCIIQKVSKIGQLSKLESSLLSNLVDEKKNNSKKVNGGKGSEMVVICSIEDILQGEGGRDYRLIMAVCPTKNLDRYEWFAEKATEFGVDRIIPIISTHSIRTTIKKERLEAIVLSATKQSLKAYLPEVEEVKTVADFLNSYRDESIIKLIAHCEEGDKKFIREILSEVNDKHIRSKLRKTPEIVIMIGPEGDFSKEEIVYAKQVGFREITLGISRLRVETAALACVSEVYFSFNNNCSNN